MSKKIHIKRFAGGKMTPQEMHVQAMHKPCALCGMPASARLRTLVQLNELIKRQPEFVAQVAATNPAGPFIPTVPTTYGPMVKVSDVGACTRCRKQAEIAAARGPSWAIVEISEGPEARNPVHAQVPGLIG